jgi:hypothetical protein
VLLWSAANTSLLSKQINIAKVSERERDCGLKIYAISMTVRSIFFILVTSSALFQLETINNLLFSRLQFFFLLFGNNAITDKSCGSSLYGGGCSFKQEISRASEHIKSEKLLKFLSHFCS